MNTEGIEGIIILELLLLYLLIMDIATCYYRLYSFEEAFVFIVQDFPNAIFATTFSYN